MSTSQIGRPRFSEGQYLGAGDLTAVVEYARAQMARHLLGGHTWGIAMGLQLEQVESAAGGDQVEVYLQPGYAWDGFGRPIVVLAPYRLPAELFKRFVHDPSLDDGDPAGRLIEVWLRYDEAATGGPMPGFEVCETEDQSSRVQETFRLEVGERTTHAARHDPVSIAGYSVDAQEARRVINPAAPPVYDESIPHQALPADEERARWLIPLGYVRWSPNPDPSQPGWFVELTDDDRQQSRRMRRYIGVVAEGVQAADGIIRLRRRNDDPAPPKPWSDDLVWVEGRLRVDGDVNLFGGRVQFLNAMGLDEDVPLVMSRIPKQLRIQIGSSEDGDNALLVGPDVDGALKAGLIVRDDGKVGIGTEDPAERLDVRGQIKLGERGDLFALAAQQSLRVITGIVNDSGGPVTGEGFSSSRLGTDRGSYRVEFMSPFSAPPIVLASAVDSVNEDNVVTVLSITEGGFEVIAKDVAGVEEPLLQDTAFSFVALGGP